ncbi:MAG TPA: bifunctional aspartate kinase/diaminopimelate decarboxylase [Rhodanobacteraceae bacterium]|jgi:diaminopimelate decarboxylase/aspartate kinase|nr:bifunctional aspartate kinase/diaminopimelate decarboxylase [Rhodanobacteraceae bacterium]
MTASAAAPLAPDAPWVVLKFGGTSVATVDRWRTIRQLAAARRAEGARVVIVVSALAGVTDALKALCTCAPAEREPALAQLVERHRFLAGEMGLAETAELDCRLLSLQALMAESQGRQRDNYWWQAAVQGHGELLSSALGAAFMSANGLPTHWLDAREALLAREVPFLNERARALSAQVQVEADPAFAAALAARSDVFITQGFIARDGEGHTVLLGRGGSDTSAAHIGALLRASRVEIWTDVAGMFTADPRQVPGARLLQRLDYDEAQEIATTGAKVLHARCISPCRRARVPLLIKDTRHPGFEGTLIGPLPAEAAPSVKAISSRRGITLVSMETSGMWQQVGFLADVFAAFKQHGLSVDLIGSAETNVTVSLDPTENLLDSDVVAALAADLAKVCRVKVIAPCAAVTLVGRGMRSMLHRLSGVLAEFGRERVHLISQSSNNLNLTFVVDEAMLDGLLPRLHELLIRAGALRTDDSALFGPSWQELYGEGARRVRAPWWRAARDSLLELADATPRYVYHLPTVRAQAQALRAMRSVDRLYYAIKANPHPAILRTLAQEGFGFECVSPGELDAVDAIGEANGSPRLFTPNFAPRADYAQALQRDIATTLDALHPLQQWPGLFAGREIMLRVDLGRGLGHHDKVRTGGATSKFGLPLDQLGTFLELAQAQDARIVGLHAHLGSGILDVAHWSGVCAQLASLAERIGNVRVLNLGGGLGVPSHPGEAELDPAAVDAALAEVKRAYPQYELWLEPGRWLVADAGVLLARVTQAKRKGALEYLGCDAGMHALIRPALYDAWHEIANLTRLAAPADTLYQVVGPICESGDVLGSDRRLPRSEEGDVLLIGQAGAYGESMASHYNLRPLAGTAIIE